MHLNASLIVSNLINVNFVPTNYRDIGTHYIHLFYIQLLIFFNIIYTIVLVIKSTTI